MLGMDAKEEDSVIIKAKSKKKIIVQTLLPEKIETLPWAGYLGINLLDKVVEILRQSRTTLLFTNTRSQTEIWYRNLIEKFPEFAGLARFTSWITR
jgi:ATP-dependent Lhr-like helicase